MLRANVYSIQPLSPDIRDAIGDGIGMVAAYTGQTIVTKELGIRIPLNDHGRVNPARVGFGNLDKMVELHLMAVPLDPGASERIGLAGKGRGWGFVDTSTDSAGVIRIVTAHEVGHALGFVLPGAEQADPESSSHCCNQNCIMHKQVIIAADEIHQSRTILQRIKRGVAQRRGHEEAVEKRTQYSLFGEQYDFCEPCKVDMYHVGDENIQQLRHDRLFVHERVR